MLTYEKLDEEQRAFWDRWAEPTRPDGEVRRQLSLMRRERYFPAWGNLVYKKLAEELTPELNGEHGERFASELLADETKLIAYSAALRLQGV